MAARHEMTQQIRNLRPVFYQIGLLAGLLLVLGAFRWTVKGETTYVPQIESYTDSLPVYLGEIKIIEEKQAEEAKDKIKTPPDPKNDQFKIDETNKTLEKSEDKKTGEEEKLKGLLTTRPFIPEGPQEFEDDEPIWVPGILPEFPGGDEARNRFFQKNFIVPSIVLETAKSTISITIKCVIEKDGSVTNIEILKDGGYPEAAEAFVKAAYKMPKWTPGKQNYHPVRVYISIPMKIKIGN